METKGKRRREMGGGKGGKGQVNWREVRERKRELIERERGRLSD